MAQRIFIRGVGNFYSNLCFSGKVVYKIYIYKKKSCRPENWLQKLKEMKNKNTTEGLSIPERNKENLVTAQ